MTHIMQTASGNQLDLLQPKMDQLDWRDIANVLSRICRFGGHLPEDIENYSVAQHSCHVADILPIEYRLAGLLHDAKEFVIGDQIYPLQCARRALTRDSATEMIGDNVQALIHASAGLNRVLKNETLAAVKHADLVILATERRDLLAPERRTGSHPTIWAELPAPINKIIKPWNRVKAADEFLSRLNRWIGLASREI